MSPESRSTTLPRPVPHSASASLCAAAGHLGDGLGFTRSLMVIMVRLPPFSCAYRSPPLLSVLPVIDSTALDVYHGGQANKRVMNHHIPTLHWAQASSGTAVEKEYNGSTCGSRSGGLPMLGILVDGCDVTLVRGHIDANNLTEQEPCFWCRISGSSRPSPCSSRRTSV
jgi:hypothetical protein